MSNNRNQRPPKGYTDEQWQVYFKILKLKTKQSKLKRMPVTKEVQGSEYVAYHGKTQYQYYCSFINDILSNIRAGNTDYCFYIYQILDLLKYEHDNLKVTWLENQRCFSVSLSKK